jgi:ribosomal protein S18 acetylase RimI-like enzyme
MASTKQVRPRETESSIRPVPEVEIRRLTGEDATGFSRLRLEALEREPQAFSASPEEYRAMTLDTIAKRLGSGSDDRNFVLGAAAENRLVGMAGFYQEPEPKNRHKGHVWGVYVTQDWRGKGIGRMLLSDLIQRARGKPEIEQLHLAVASAQNAAKRLYESLGFAVYGREPRAIKVGDTYMDEDLMVLQLRREKL